MGYFIVYLFSVTTAFLLLQRQKEEWSDSMGKHWEKMKSFSSSILSWERDEELRLPAVSERLTKLESKTEDIMAQFKKSQEPPEKRSKDAAQNAVDEILRNRW